MKTAFIALPTLLLMSSLSSGKDPIVGDWKWFTGTVVSFTQKGEAINSSGHRGKWERAQGRNGEYKYTVNWQNGQFIDSIEMSKDRKMLSGTNQNGGNITGDRWDKK